MAFWHHFINTILPPRCANCGQWTTKSDTLCPLCWRSVTFIVSPKCSICGWPLPYPGTACIPCSSRRPRFSTGRSIFYYNGAIRSLILQLKHHDATYVAPSLASFLHGYGGDIFEEIDGIIPVPLHRWRLMGRGFNQTTLVAFHLAKYRKIPIKINILKRHKFSLSQARQPGHQRRSNIKNAFSITPHGRTWIAHKRLLILDDVWTTGSTLDECSKILLKNGANDVKALTIARVIPSF